MVSVPGSVRQRGGFTRYCRKLGVEQRSRLATGSRHIVAV